MAGLKVQKDFFFTLLGLDGPLVGIGDGFAARALRERGEERRTASNFIYTLLGEKKKEDV